jgi:uncharacterized alkaline shock family protein YloU
MNLKKPLKVDTKEFELPETVFSRDIENQVFQGIVLQCLSNIEGISLVEDNIIESLLGRTTFESSKGILAEQDMKSNTINIRIEVNVEYGVVLPEKAEEIQTLVSEEITKLTGLHVAQVHVIFKNIIAHMEDKPTLQKQIEALNRSVDEDYTDEF